MKCDDKDTFASSPPFFLPFSNLYFTFICETEACEQAFLNGFFFFSREYFRETPCLDRCVKLDGEKGGEGGYVEKFFVKGGFIPSFPPSLQQQAATKKPFDMQKSSLFFPHFSPLPSPCSKTFLLLFPTWGPGERKEKGKLILLFFLLLPPLPPTLSTLCEN